VRTGAGPVIGAGTSFALAIGGTLTAVGGAGLNDATARWSVAAVCFVAALTIAAAVILTLRRG
jgi:hypothetical protein